MFDVPRLLAAGGRFGFGSDSNVLVSLTEELRTLECSQSLFRRARNVVAGVGGSVGRSLLDHAVAGGNAALRCSSGLAPGGDAEMVALGGEEVDHLRGDAILDQWVFTGVPKVEAVWAQGSRKVDGGRHVDRDRVWRRFRSVMGELEQG